MTEKNVGPLFRRPELLTHPNVPKPLHGVAPRVVMGTKWWNAKRTEAYAINDFHCWACGVHKTQALGPQWLEAHESYDIDYAAGRVCLKEIVALCNYCHCFIHSGRLFNIMRSGEITAERFETVMGRGFNILADAQLVPWWGTIMVRVMHDFGLDELEAHDVVKDLVPEEQSSFALWDDWRLVIGDQEFGPIRSYWQWLELYGLPPERLQSVR